MRGWCLTVQPNGSIDISPLEKGKTYDAIKRAVNDAYFDCVSLAFGEVRIDMWVDDGGLLKHLPLNRFATQMHATRVGVENACIVGPAFFTGGSDEEGDTLPLTEEEMRFLLEMLMSKAQEDFTGPHFSWKGLTWSQP